MVLTNCTYKSIMPASGKSKDMVTTTPPSSKAALGWAWLPGCHCTPHLPTSPYCFLHDFICQPMRERSDSSLRPVALGEMGKDAEVG